MKVITAEWVAIAEADFTTVERELRARKDPNYGAACYHAQQCAEKYLKARLIEGNKPFPMIHDLGPLLDLAVAVEPQWELLRPDLAFLTDFAVMYRYPGHTPDRETALEARARCQVFRAAARQALGAKDPAPSRRRR